MRLLLLTLCIIFILSMPTHASDDQRIILTGSNWVPYMYIDDQGKNRGLYFEVLQEVFETQLGLELRMDLVPWKRAQHNVKLGLADIMVTVPTQERLLYSQKSAIPVLDIFLHIYTYKDHPKFEDIRSITQPEDIKLLQLLPVTNLGNGWHKKHIDSVGIDTHYVPSEKNAFEVLAAKRADITIEPIFAGSHLIKELELGDRIISTEARFGPLQMYLLLSNKSSFAPKKEEIDQALVEISKSGRLKEIVESYK